jgi:hypothetical protein
VGVHEAFDFGLGGLFRGVEYPCEVGDGVFLCGVQEEAGEEFALMV